MASEHTPVLALTPGEPAGIGPDLCLQTAPGISEARLIIFADPGLLEERRQLLGIQAEINPLSFKQIHTKYVPGAVNVVPVDLVAKTQPGELNKDNASYVLSTLRAAVQACIAGYCDALVTAPVHKGIINDAGISFSGHTEFLAEMTGGDPVMMLACPGLRVALATTHLPLKDISAAITTGTIEKVVRATHHDLKSRFGIAQPAIYVCGLNPHAGENGHLGMEEIETIIPTLEKLRTEGIHLIGPLPADTIFTPKYMQQADVILAMYHDQGLPVLKHMGFGQAVNITLGLPLIRTSVDHGTALELAGSGRADNGSLKMAIDTAIEMVRNSKP
ncbi:MAG: 4-hydroxythreonine-4-phosphate dehydrogenase PdxA [Gammaproteobacteria bacterium]|nr:4-hydroxythreonine-4-phosphate dehydrogenase PdxA [Gammaproteobacteria bacterium]